jgi:hypothetical protein
MSSNQRKKSKVYADGNDGQAPKCGIVKLVIGIPTLLLFIIGPSTLNELLKCRQNNIHDFLTNFC